MLTSQRDINYPCKFLIILATIEFNEHHVRVARQNIDNAELTEPVELYTGAALDILPRLKATFNLIFIDADKVNNPRYLEWALKLSRPSTVIVGEKGWDGFVMVIVKAL